jgi:hypothetical protein
MPPAAIPIIAATAAVVGTGYSIYAGQKAASQQKKAFAAQQQQANLQEARQRRDAIRASRLAYAQAQAAGETQNTSGSSSSEGGRSSIVSQLSDNLSFLDQYGVLTDQAQTALGKANSYAASSKMGAGIADLGMTIFSNAPKLQELSGKVFKSG